MVSPYEWDLANLYTSGEITLVSVPEPAGAVMIALAAAAFLGWRRVEADCVCASDAGVVA